MGYTHYWGYTKKRGDAAKNEAAYQQAIKDCNKVILYIKGNVCNLSGYNAHGAKYGGINLNGVKTDGHETFYMREHFAQNRTDFCKTARKGYDIAVVACLAILKYRLRGAFHVSSDGSGAEWVEGVELARRVLKRKVPNPIATLQFRKRG